MVIVSWSCTSSAYLSPNCQELEEWLRTYVLVSFLHFHRINICLKLALLLLCLSYPQSHQLFRKMPINQVYPKSVQVSYFFCLHIVNESASNIGNHVRDVLEDFTHHTTSTFWFKAVNSTAVITSARSSIATICVHTSTLFLKFSSKNHGFNRFCSSLQLACLLLPNRTLPKEFLLSVGAKGCKLVLVMQVLINSLKVTWTAISFLVELKTCALVIFNTPTTRQVGFLRCNQAFELIINWVTAAIWIQGSNSLLCSWHTHLMLPLNFVQVARGLSDSICSLMNLQ